MEMVLTALPSIRLDFLENAYYFTYINEYWIIDNKNSYKGQQAESARSRVATI